MTGKIWSVVAGMLFAGVTGAAVAEPTATIVVAEDPAAFQAPRENSLRGLTLGETLSRVLAGSPELAAADAALRASEADARQSVSLINPELTLEVENFAGSGALSGFDGAETTLRLDQTIELGGKRMQRRANGMAERETAARKQALNKAGVYLQTVEAFMSVLAAEQRLLLAEQQLSLAIQTRDTVKAKVESGRSSAIEGMRSEPLVVEARLGRDRAASSLTVARKALSVLIGEDDPAAIKLQGDLGALPDVPTVSDIEGSPELAFARALRDRAAQELSAQKLQAIPDLTLGVGVRRFEGDGDVSVVAGISIPLPIFDQNRNGILAATARLEEAQHAERNVRFRLAADADLAFLDLRNKREEALALREELLPLATQSFEAIEYGYRAGKFGILDLLEAQRQLVDVQSRLLEAQVNSHVAAARLSVLLGEIPFSGEGINQ